MPHIIVKLWPGRSEEQKVRLARQFVQDAVSILGVSVESLSVAIEEIKPSDWTEQVYRPEFHANPHLYQQPGYGPPA